MFYPVSSRLFLKNKKLFARRVKSLTPQRFIFRVSRWIWHRSPGMVAVASQGHVPQLLLMNEYNFIRYNKIILHGLKHTVNSFIIRSCKTEKNCQFM